MQSIAQLLELQCQLAAKFWQIEADNGFDTGSTLRGNWETIQSMAGQAVIRRYAWQITEEVTEAIDKHNDFFGFAEEVSDAFHFLLELMIILRFDQDPNFVSDIQFDWDQYRNGELPSPWYDSWERGFLRFIRDLGMTMNLLKNRPWRLDSRDTDEGAFKFQIKNCFKQFLIACQTAAVTYPRLWDAYEKKLLVNIDRSEGKYAQ
jgi:hypothetical protein